jgi:hypothetical protein
MLQLVIDGLVVDFDQSHSSGTEDPSPDSRLLSIGIHPNGLWSGPIERIAIATISSSPKL